MGVDNLIGCVIALRELQDDIKHLSLPEDYVGNMADKFDSIIKVIEKNIRVKNVYKKFLVPTKKLGASNHIWLGQDTACKMYSSGTIKKDYYTEADQPISDNLCHMCQVNYSKIVL